MSVFHWPTAAAHRGSSTSPVLAPPLRMMIDYLIRVQVYGHSYVFAAGVLTGRNADSFFITLQVP